MLISLRQASVLATHEHWGAGQAARKQLVMNGFALWHL